MSFTFTEGAYALHHKQVDWLTSPLAVALVTETPSPEHTLTEALGSAFSVQSLRHPTLLNGVYAADQIDGWALDAPPAGAVVYSRGVALFFLSLEELAVSLTLAFPAGIAQVANG